MSLSLQPSAFILKVKGHSPSTATTVAENATVAQCIEAINAAVATGRAVTSNSTGNATSS